MEGAEIVVETKEEVEVEVADETKTQAVQSAVEPVEEETKVIAEPAATENVVETKQAEDDRPAEPASESAPEQPEPEKVEVPVVDEAPTQPQPEQPQQQEEVVSIVVEEPVVEKEPEETPEEKARKEQERLDAMTSYIDTIEEVTISLKDEDHPQLHRPGVRNNVRRGRTVHTKSFADLEEEERQREEELKKPRANVDQAFEDKLGLLSAGKGGQSSVSIAQEAQQMQAKLAQKAKERKEKEEAERKAREAAAIKEEEEAAARESNGGNANRKSIRKSKKQSRVETPGNDDAKVVVDLAGDGGPEAENKLVDKLKIKMQDKGCCVIS